MLLRVLLPAVLRPAPQLRTAAMAMVAAADAGTNVVLGRVQAVMEEVRGVRGRWGEEEGRVVLNRVVPINTLKLA